MNDVVPLRIYTRSFWLLCTSSLMFFASFNMLLPELASYLSSLGGAEYKGFIISLFTLTAMISRPFSGKLADTIGRIPVMITGAAVCFICSLFYPILTTVSGFLLLRLIHGFSTGFTPTGQSAYLSDIIPVTRRGEAMGILGTAGSLGMACGPAVGGLLSNYFGLATMFYCSSGFALISVIILSGIKETLREKHKLHPSLLKITREDLFEPRVTIPCLIMVLCSYSYGAVFTVIPDFGEFVGIKNKGVLFLYLTIASLFIRLIGGKASDRWGRQKVLRVTSFVICVSMIIIALAETPLQLAIGAMVYGIGHGATSPTLLAWATDLSDARFKGRGIASLYIFMELGIGVGAFVSGFIYNNEASNFFITFIVCSSLAAAAFLYLSLARNVIKVPS